MEDKENLIGENELVDEDKDCTGDERHESTQDGYSVEIRTVDESNKAAAVTNIEIKDGKAPEDEISSKDAEGTQGKKTTFTRRDTFDEKTRMESYVIFVNKNWKQALTKLKKKDHTEENHSTNNASMEKMYGNAVSKETVENIQNCNTPEGFLHKMWLHSLAKGEALIGGKEKRMPRKKSWSPYMIFCKEKEKELSHLTWKEFGAITRKAWKELAEEEREKFKGKCKEMREKEREMFMEKFNEVPEKETEEEMKAVKMAEKLIKKPRSAFSIYTDGLIPEVSKLEAATMWNGLTGEEQKVFMEREKEELECYKLEIQEDRRKRVKEGSRPRKRRNRVTNYNTAVNDKEEMSLAGEKRVESGDRIGKPRSAFVIFMDEVVNDALSTGDMDAGDLKKWANNQWRKLGKEEREFFKAQAKDERTQCKSDDKIVVSGGECGPVVGANGENVPIVGSGGQDNTCI